MNPIFQMLKQKPQKRQSNSNLNSIISDVQAGALNPRNKVLEMLNSMGAPARNKIQEMLPTVRSIAKACGLPEHDINTAINELKGYA